jgi:hypothetical protein
MTAVTGDKGRSPIGPPLCMNKVAEYFGTIRVNVPLCFITPLVLRRLNINVFLRFLTLNLNLPFDAYPELFLKFVQANGTEIQGPSQISPLSEKIDR